MRLKGSNFSGVTRSSVLLFLAFPVRSTAAIHGMTVNQMSMHEMDGAHHIALLIFITQSNAQLLQYYHQSAIALWVDKDRFFVILSNDITCNSLSDSALFHLSFIRYFFIRIIATIGSYHQIDIDEITTANSHKSNTRLDGLIKNKAIRTSTMQGCIVPLEVTP